jgi:hypothetical protein
MRRRQHETKCREETTQYNDPRNNPQATGDHSYLNFGESSCES